MMRPRLAYAALAIMVLLAAACSVAPEQDAARPRPNIVLFMVEDLSPRIAAFGDSVAQTPNLDRMARDGVRYTNVFASAGVCAPSRAAVMTGVHQATLRAQHMRTSAYVWTDGSGRRGYEAVPPPEVKAFPELLRAAGYYTINNSKTDYQFGSPVTIWDENGPTAHWKNSAGKPFFAMYSQIATHESSLFMPDKLTPAFASSRDAAAAMEARRAALPHRTRPEDVVVPAYYPDTPTVRADIARQYDNVQLMDAWVGERMAELQAAGVLDNTIVIWATDHGDGLPRGKRSIYDSGLHVPMIIQFPDRRLAGTSDDRMISFVDLAPTILSLAGMRSQPAFLQGVDALGPQGRAQKQVFAARDRFDESTDLSRAVRTDRFKYIRNEYPDTAFYLPLAYRENVPMMAEMRSLFAAGKLSPLQASYFQTPRAEEELYDLRADPDEVRNLASDPQFRTIKSELAQTLSAWRTRINDPGRMPEDQMIKAAWGADAQPQTAKPVIRRSGVSIAVSSETPGASIAYRQVGEQGWRLYTGPFDAPSNGRIEAKAIRYGFVESEVASE